MAKAAKGSKPKAKLPEPFSPEICQRLRSLAGLRNKAMTKRKDAFDARDEIEQQIRECTDGEVKKIEGLKAQHYDVVHEISRWQDLYKTANNKIVETIERGDQLELIPSLNPRPTEKSLFNEDKLIGGDDSEEGEVFRGEGDGEEAGAEKEPATVG